MKMYVHLPPVTLQNLHCSHIETHISTNWSVTFVCIVKIFHIQYSCGMANNHTDYFALYHTICHKLSLWPLCTTVALVIVMHLSFVLYEHNVRMSVHILLFILSRPTLPFWSGGVGSLVGKALLVRFSIWVEWIFTAVILLELCDKRRKNHGVWWQSERSRRTWII